MGGNRLWRWLELKVEQREAARKRGVQPDFRDFSPLVSNVVNLMESGKLKKLIDPDHTKYLILKLKRLDPEIARRITINVLLAPRKGDIDLDMKVWKDTILDRRTYELKKLKEEFKHAMKFAKKNDNDLNKSQIYESLRPHYMEKRDAVESFFSDYLAILENGVHDVGIEFKKREEEVDRIKQQRDIYVNRKEKIEAAKTELILKGEATMKEKSFLEDAREFLDAMKSARNGIPIVIAISGLLGVTIPEKIKLFAKDYLSKFSTVNQFLRTKFPELHNAAEAALIVGVSLIAINIYRKAKASYETMRKNAENYKKIVRLSKIAADIRLRLKGKIGRKLDEIRAETVILILDTPREEMGSLINKVQRKFSKAMESSDYPFKPQ